MNFRPTGEQELLRHSVRTLLRATDAPIRARAVAQSGRSHDPELWRTISELGWPGLLLPERIGGQSLSAVELVLLMEELGAALAPVPLLSTVLAGWCLAHTGMADQESRLAALASGREVATLAWMEDNDWNPAGVQLTARAVGGRIRLRGRKLFVLDAAAADWLVVSARTEDGGVALYLVGARAPGIRLTLLPALDFTRPLYEIACEDAMVDPNARLTDDLLPLEAALDLGRLAIAAEMTGLMRRLTEMTVAHARSRIQFGGPIGRFQAVQHRCVDMFVETEALRSLVWWAACLLRDRDPAAGLACAAAKAVAAEVGPAVAASALQVHGGIGFTWEHDLHLYFRRVKADELLFGDAAYHRWRVAGELAAAREVN